MSEKSFKSFVISFFLCTFAPDNEPLKNRLVAQRRVVLQYAYRGRIRKSEGFQIVTSKTALSPKPPKSKDGLRFLPKLRKNERNAKKRENFFAFRVLKFGEARVTKKVCNISYIGKADFGASERYFKPN